MEDKLQISEIIKRIVKNIIPECKILLFGSRTRDDFKFNSDYDILIIVQNQIPIKEKFSLRTQVRKALLEVNIFSDVLIQSSNEIEKKILLPGHIVKTIMREGVFL